VAEERLQRKLAAILSADVVGYSRLMGIDEAGTLAGLKSMRRDLIDPVIAAHSGRTIKLIGDGSLVEFGSGSSRKVRILLAAAPTIAAYVPVDISSQMLLREAQALRRGQFVRSEASTTKPLSFRVEKDRVAHFDFNIAVANGIIGAHAFADALCAAFDQAEADPV